MADGKLLFDTALDASGLNRGLAGLAGVAKSSISGVVKTIAGVSAALAGVGAASIKVGSKFETGMAKVTTMVDTAKTDMNGLGKDILRISNETGQSATSLSDAMYSALSAGVKVEQVSGFVEKSAKLATAGFTTTESAVDVLSSVINAYGDEVIDADKASKILLQTQNKGKTTVDELASSLSQVTPTAAAMSVSFDQVGAALATITAKGTPTAQATTQLNALLAELGKSGTQAQKALVSAAEGTEYAGMSFQAMMKAGVPLNEVIDLMSGYADESGLSLLDLFSSIEAGKAALSVGGDSSKVYAENLAAMGTSADVVGEAYAKMADTFEVQSKRAKEGVKNLGIAIYKDLLNGPAKDMAKAANGWIKELSDAFEKGGVKKLSAAAGKVVAELIQKLLSGLPAISKAAAQMITSLVKGLASNAPAIVRAMTDTVKGVVSAVRDALPELIRAGKEIAIALLDGIAELVPGLTPVTEALKLLVTDIEGVTSALIPAAAAIAAYKISMGIAGIIQAATVALGGMTVAQYALNVAMSLNPIGLLVAGLTLLVAGIAVAVKSSMDAEKADYALGEAEQELVDRIGERKEAYDKVQESQQASLSASMTEIGHAAKLKTELDGLVDKNGKVKKGYEDRVNFILSELSKATGTEITQADLVKEGYAGISTEINKLIEAKRADIALTALQSSYTEAVQNQQQAFTDHGEALRKLTENRTKQSVAERTIAAALSGDMKLHIKDLEAVMTHSEELQSEEKELSKAFEVVEETLVGYNTTIQNYEGLSSAIISRDTDKINSALQRATAGFQTAENGTRASLQNQVASLEQNMVAMQDAVNNGAPGATQAMADSAKAMYDAATAEYEKLPPEAGKAGADSANKLVVGMKSVDAGTAATKHTSDYIKSQQANSGKVVAAVKKTTTDAKTASTGVEMGSPATKHNSDYLKSQEQSRGKVVAAVKKTTTDAKTASTGVEMESPATKHTSDYIKATQSKRGAIVSTAKQGVVAAKTAMSSVEMRTPGAMQGDQYKGGIASKSGVARSAAKTVANSARSGASSVSLWSAGADMITGFRNGIISKAQSLVSAAVSAASSAVQGVKSFLGIRSPSRLMAKEVGQHIMPGAVVGIKQSMPKVLRQMDATMNSFAESVKGSAKKALGPTSSFGLAAARDLNEVGKRATEGLASGVQKGAQSAVKAAMDAATKLKTSVKKELTELNSAYKKEVSDLKNSRSQYASSIMPDLFKATTPKEAVGKKDILANAKTNAARMKSSLTVLKSLEKKGFPPSFLNQFYALGPDSLEQLQQLDSMSKGEQKTYLSYYTQSENSAKKIAEMKYKAEFDAINASYEKDMDKLQQSVQTKSQKIGEELKNGLIKGAKMSVKQASALSKDLSSAIVKQIKKDLGINSPSRVMANEIGQYLMPGVTMGMERSMPAALRQVDYDMAALTTRMKSAVQQEALQIGAKLSNSATGFGGAQSTNITDDHSVNETVIVNQPVATPAELYRAAKRRAKEIAYA